MPRWCSSSTKLAEVVRRAEARGGRVVPGDLISPRPAERVLGDRQQLDMCEAERGRHGRRSARASSRYDVHAVAPRGEMQLVDPQRLAGAVPAGCHPRFVAPHVRARRCDDARGGRRALGRVRHRIGLQQRAAVRRFDLRTCSDSRPPPTRRCLPTRRTCPAVSGRRRRPSRPSRRPLAPTWRSAPTPRTARLRRAAAAHRATATAVDECPRRRSGDRVRRAARSEAYVTRPAATVNADARPDAVVGVSTAGRRRHRGARRRPGKGHGSGRSRRGRVQSRSSRRRRRRR